MIGLLLPKPQITRFLTFESTYAGKSKGFSLYPFVLANPLSDLELNMAIICTSLPPLKAFVQRFGLRILGNLSHKFTHSGNNDRNSKRAAPHSSTLHPSRASRKRPGAPDEEADIDGSYLELVEGKSTDQNYNMTTKLVESHSSFTGNST